MAKFLSDAISFAHIPHPVNPGQSSELRLIVESVSKEQFCAELRGSELLTRSVAVLKICSCVCGFIPPLPLVPKQIGVGDEILIPVMVGASIRGSKTPCSVVDSLVSRGFVRFIRVRVVA